MRINPISRRESENLSLSVCYKIIIRVGEYIYVKIIQEVWRCEGKNVFLHNQFDFKRLKGEDYGTDISNGRYEPAFAKHS